MEPFSKKDLAVIQNHFDTITQSNKEGDEASDRASQASDKKFSIVRGMLALCLDDQSITPKEVSESPTFSEFVEHYKREIVKLIEDEEEEEYERSIIERTHGIHALEMLQDGLEKKSTQKYDYFAFLRLKESDGLTTITFNGTLIELGEELKKITAGVSNVLMDEIDHITKSFSVEKRKDCESVFQIEFYIGSNGCLYLEIDETGGEYSILDDDEKHDFFYYPYPLTIQSHHIYEMIEKIGYRESERIDIDTMKDMFQIIKYTKSEDYPDSDDNSDHV